ncbi:MAG: heavy metal translocating P-type ATPase, partial [Clostridia bacterium]
MTKKQKKNLIRILSSFFLLIICSIIKFDNFEENSSILKFLAFFIPYIIISFDVLTIAIKNIFKGQVLDENFLMTIATIGAFCIGDYAEGVAVMLFYQVGELFQSYAVGKSRLSIKYVIFIRPEFENVLMVSDDFTLYPEVVEINDVIIIKPGERIPLDATVIFGESSINTSALTGESAPTFATVGCDIISGCINIDGVLKAKVKSKFENSTVSKILQLVENSAEKKAKSEKFITKFSKYYTPIVVISALLLAIIPPLFAGDWSSWINRALIFLVISCPCALVISVPLSFFGGIGGASKQGILIKGSNYLEALSKTSIVIFDKTGTLTKGNFNVDEIKPVNINEKDLLKFCAYAESFSSHPVAKAIVSEYFTQTGEVINKSTISNVNEIAGNGVLITLDNDIILAGNDKLMMKHNILFKKSNMVGTVVYVAKNGEYLGYIIVSDEIKKDSSYTIETLKSIGIEQTIMLTGDKKQVGEHVANLLKIDKVYTELLPAQKAEITENILKTKEKKDTVIFVGDGINDAPVLKMVDVGIAMGAIGSDAAIEAADVVL